MYWPCVIWTPAGITMHAGHSPPSTVSLPTSPQAYLLAARMLLRREYVPIAETSARKALALNPSLPRAHFLLGEIALAHGQFADAIADFQKEGDLDPLNGAVYERLGDAYIRAGDFDRAQQALNRAVLLEPNVNIPFILLGKVLLKQQKPVDGQNVS